MAGGKRRKSFGGANKRVKSAQKPFKPRFNNRNRKRQDKKPKPSAEDLDRDLEKYWGEKVAAEHLDKDMDEYWEKNKPK